MGKHHPGLNAVSPAAHQKPSYSESHAESRAAEPAQPSASAHGVLTLHTLLQLQGAIGNQAVTQRLRSLASAPLPTHAIQRQIDKEVLARTHDATVGYIDYAFNWTATGDHHSGYIIQQITRVEQENEGDPVTTTYWEAWWVDETGAIKLAPDGGAAPAPNDSWTWLSIKWGGSGSLEMTGDVYWAAEGSAAATAVDNWALGAVAQAGGLKSSNAGPAGLGARISQDTQRWEWDTTEQTDAQFQHVFDVKWETVYQDWEGWDVAEEYDENITDIQEGLERDYDIPAAIADLQAWVTARVGAKRPRPD